MADPWDDASESREFLVSAELFVSSAAGTALRKPTNTKKKIDKRENLKQSNGLVEEKRLKEKSSWLSLTKDPANTGHWRTATCKLSEEGDRCLLNIYVDESILYQTILIHLLKHTDIRHAHPSLHQRKYCLVIYCVAEKRRASANMTSEPIYLQFRSAELCNTWLALLRSYALPEIYGRWFFPEEGGSYRMWRQVELTIIQGRNLGNMKPFDGATNGLEDTDSASDQDPVDLDVLCEIMFNDEVCGRTTVKKGMGSPDWHEGFTFADLPPFENLELVVWRSKKMFKPSVLGSIRIALANFPRGEAVEGWFPVLHSASSAGELQIGDLRLKLRVDEELILPCKAYERLLKKLRSRNFLDWMTDFESKLKLKTVTTQLMSIAVADNVLIEQVTDLAYREVDGSASAHQTLFRGNNALTRIAEQTMGWYGTEFLESSIGSVLRKLIAEKVCIEVDPMRSQGKSGKDIERNVDLLIFWCRKIWAQIFSARQACPPEMRRLFHTIRELVESRFPLHENRELPWRCVSAFVFLRFIVPAILHPHLFGLCPGLPSERVQRSLTLIAKVVQSLANLNASVQKEDFMAGLKDFLRDSLPAMTDYLLAVSTPIPDEPRISMSRDSEKHLISCMQERVKTMPTLYKEAIPTLPHLLDPARHLAIITSAVIRTSRSYLQDARSREVRDRPLEELCSRCMEVEEKALQRVSQLAAQLSVNQRKRGVRQDAQFAFGPPSPTTPIHQRSDKAERPSTAPSTSDANDTRKRALFDGGATGPFVPTTPNRAGAIPKNRLVHLKSTSTDSISSHNIPRPVPQPTVVLDSKPMELPPDMDDGKRKKKLGFWRR